MQGDPIHNGRAYFSAKRVAPTPEVVVNHRQVTLLALCTNLAMTCPFLLNPWSQKLIDPFGTLKWY